MPARRADSRPVVDDDLRSVSVDEAAELLNISRWTLYENLRDGSIPSFKVRGRRLIRVRHLRAFIESAEADGYDAHEAEA